MRVVQFRHAFVRLKSVVLSRWDVSCPISHLLLRSSVKEGQKKEVGASSLNPSSALSWSAARMSPSQCSVRPPSVSSRVPLIFPYGGPPRPASNRTLLASATSINSRSCCSSSGPTSTSFEASSLSHPQTEGCPPSSQEDRIGVVESDTLPDALSLHTSWGKSYQDGKEKEEEEEGGHPVETFSPHCWWCVSREGRGKALEGAERPCGHPCYSGYCTSQDTDSGGSSRDASCIRRMSRGRPSPLSSFCNYCSYSCCRFASSLRQTRPAPPRHTFHPSRTGPFPQKTRLCAAQDKHDVHECGEAEKVEVGGTTDGRSEGSASGGGRGDRGMRNAPHSKKEGSRSPSSPPRLHEPAISVPLHPSSFLSSSSFSVPPPLSKNTFASFKKTTRISRPSSSSLPTTRPAPLLPSSTVVKAKRRSRRERAISADGEDFLLHSFLGKTQNMEKKEGQHHQPNQKASCHHRQNPNKSDEDNINNTEHNVSAFSILPSSLPSSPSSLCSDTGMHSSVLTPSSVVQKEEKGRHQHASSEEKEIKEVKKEVKDLAGEEEDGGRGEKQYIPLLFRSSIYKGGHRGGGESMDGERVAVHPSLMTFIPRSTAKRSRRRIKKEEKEERLAARKVPLSSSAPQDVSVSSGVMRVAEEKSREEDRSAISFTFHGSRKKEETKSQTIASLPYPHLPECSKEEEVVVVEVEQNEEGTALRLPLPLYEMRSKQRSRDGQGSQEDRMGEMVGQGRNEMEKWTRAMTIRKEKDGVESVEEEVEKEMSRDGSEREKKKRTKKEQWLVMNLFSGRVVSSSSPTLQGLAVCLGLEPCPIARQLVLSQSSTLESFAQALQKRELSWPRLWRSHTFFYLRRLLESTPIPLVANKVREFLKEHQQPFSAPFPACSISSGSSLTNAAWERKSNDPGEGGRQAEEGSMVAATTGTRSIPISREVEEGRRSNSDTPRPTSTTAEAGLPNATRTSATSATAPSIALAKERLLTVEDLTGEQRQVVELALQGYNMYIGGSAGTGKSVLLRVLRRRLAEEGLSVAVTATTGLAAYHIGGTTLHHRFGITLDGRFLQRKALREYDVIIIDEISMLSRTIWEELERQLRRAHRNELPFGGVQIILCGDFMQLGAISSPSLVHSPLFRHHFVMLKLIRTLRQQEHMGFYVHLQALRHGKMLPTWNQTVHFMDSSVRQLPKGASSPTALEVKKTEGEKVEREGSSPPSLSDPFSSPSCALPSLPKGVMALPPLPSTMTCSSSPSSFVPPLIVEDAINLLPTNALVRQANEVMLDKLRGETVTFQSMSLPPFLQGRWTPSYLLSTCSFSSPSSEADDAHPRSIPVSAVDRSLLLHHLHRFVISCLPPPSSHSSAAKYFMCATRGGEINPPDREQEANDGSVAGGPHEHSPFGESMIPPSLSHEQEEREEGDVEELRLHPERHVVLYPLYNDAFVFRVRLPRSWTGRPEEEEKFLSALTNRLGDFLDTLGLGIHRRDILPSGDGLHTEEDEFSLQQLTLRSHMAEPLLCKVGAKVMLRANLSRTLVNGSLGTIVGFVEMRREHLSGYLHYICSAPPARTPTTASSNFLHPHEAALVATMEQYADFLRYEHNFDIPVMPLVDFSEDGKMAPIAIPPVLFPVGGLQATHYYAGGVVRLPLTLAYAFTVHKVQGLTLVGRVHLELSKMWPCEHLLYVAMSRVRNPEQMSVSNFRIDLVRVETDCLLFDRSLPCVDQAGILPNFIPATWVTDPGKRKRVLHRQQRRQRRRKERREKGKTTLLPSKHPTVYKSSNRYRLRREIDLIQEKFLAKLHQKERRTKYATH